MNSEIKKCELHPVRLDSDVWAAVKAHPQSLNKLLREVLLSDVKYTPKTEAAIQKNVTPRRQSKKEKIVAELAASDLTAQQVGREDIEYGLHTELPRGEHVANIRGIRPKGDKTR